MGELNVDWIVRFAGLFGKKEIQESRTCSPDGDVHRIALCIRASDDDVNSLTVRDKAQTDRRIFFCRHVFTNET